MPDSLAPDDAASRPARDPDEREPQEPLPELVVGRGRRLRDYALQRLRASRPLQISAAVAVGCYGALPFLVIYPEAADPRVDFWTAALMVLMSLASWTLLFWWYPVLQRTQKVLGDGRQARIIASTLEAVAIGCVVVVHALMAFIIVRAGVTP